MRTFAPKVPLAFLAAAGNSLQGLSLYEMVPESPTHLYIWALDVAASVAKKKMAMDLIFQSSSWPRAAAIVRLRHKWLPVASSRSTIE
jgi:hypothetical protein